MLMTEPQEPAAACAYMSKFAQECLVLARQQHLSFRQQAIWILDLHSQACRIEQCLISGKEYGMGCTRAQAADSRTSKWWIDAYEAVLANIENNVFSLPIALSR